MARGGKRPGAGRPSNEASRRSIAEAAREYGEEALATLAKVMRDNEAPPAARISASAALLDRGYGKPPQFTTGDNEAFRRATEMTDDELARIASGSGDAAPAEESRPPVTH